MSDRILKESDVVREVKSLLVSDEMGYLNDLEYGNNQALCHVIDHIEDLPSAEWQEWIPCSEREPNEFENVLVLLSDGTMDVLQLTDYLDIWGNVKWCHAVNHGMGYAVSNNDVVAWMPLPEPWKGADDE